MVAGSKRWRFPLPTGSALPFDRGSLATFGGGPPLFSWFPSSLSSLLSFFSLFSSSSFSSLSVSGSSLSSEVASPQELSLARRMFFLDDDDDNVVGACGEFVISGWRWTPHRRRFITLLNVAWQLWQRRRPFFIILWLLLSLLVFRNRYRLVVLRLSLVFDVDDVVSARGCGNCAVRVKCWKCCQNSRMDNFREPLTRCCS